MVMTKEQTDENGLEFLSARIRKGLPAAFRATVPPGYKIGHVLSAAIDLWVDLPEDVRLHLLAPGNKDSFVEAVQGIVDAALQKRTLPGKPRKKRAVAARRNDHTDPK